MGQQLVKNCGQPGIELHKGSEKSLLVDDEEAIVDSIQTILSNLGYMVVPFKDSRSAFDAFQNDPAAFDLVITDYTRPNMTGIEIAEKIKFIREDIPIILCLGFMRKDMEGASRKTGIDEILRKPINTFELASAIGRIHNHK